MGCDLDSGHTDLDVYDDKGYVGQAVKEGLEVENRIGLHQGVEA